MMTKVLLVPFLLVVNLVVSAPVAQETNKMQNTVINFEDADTAIRLLAREIEEASKLLVNTHKVIDSPKSFKVVSSSLEKVPESNRYRMSLVVETVGVIKISDNDKNNPTVQDTDFLQLASLTLENVKSILTAPRADSTTTYAIVSPNIEKVLDEAHTKQRMSFEIEPVITKSTLRKRSADGIKTSNKPNIIKQIIKALEGREDMVSTIEYLDKSSDDEDFLRQLPLFNADDGKLNQYTFFAPTSWGIHSSIPQDIANPFNYDNQLRHNVFLRHFVRRLLTKDDLEKDGLTELTMADNTRLSLTRDKEGERRIGERSVVITNENIDIRVDGDTLGSNTIRIFVVNGIFALNDEVSEAINRNPNPPVNPFIGVTLTTDDLLPELEQKTK